MTEPPATYDAGTPATHAVPMSELFYSLAEMNRVEADLKQGLKEVQADIAAMRSAIEQGLRDRGTTSITDAATGTNARIETRRTWQVTDREALERAARMRTTLSLIVETVDEKKAIEWMKSGTLREPLPGIEQVQTEYLKVTQKGGK